MKTLKCALWTFKHQIVLEMRVHCGISIILLKGLRSSHFWKRVYIYYLSNQKFQRLCDFHLDDIVTVSVDNYSVISSRLQTTSWRHFIWETRCQDGGCFILYLIWFPSFSWIFFYCWIRLNSRHVYISLTVLRKRYIDTLKDVYLSQLPHYRLIKRLAKRTVPCKPLVIEKRQLIIEFLLLLINVFAMCISGYVVELDVHLNLRSLFLTEISEQLTDSTVQKMNLL